MLSKTKYLALLFRVSLVSNESDVARVFLDTQRLSKAEFIFINSAFEVTFFVLIFLGPDSILMVCVVFVSYYRMPRHYLGRCAN